MSSAHTRIRRTKIIAWTILILGVAASIAGVLLFDLQGAGLVVGFLGGIPAVIALYLAWASYRDDRIEAQSAGSAGDVADRLALAVRVNVEADVPMLNDPYPIPVGWGPAPIDLVQPWDTILRLAREGAGWTPVDELSWLTGSDEIRGSRNELADKLQRIPTRRLVVLGEGGSGKSVLVTRLILNMLASRGPGTAVPVRFTAASWDPEESDLRSWMRDRLERDYSGLSGRHGQDSKTRAEILLASGLVVPILDGFDEIPPHLRRLALTVLNETLRPGESVVITSRVAEYRDAVSAPGRGEVRLIGAAGLLVDPLQPEDAENYLRNSAGSSGSTDRWQTFLAEMLVAGPVRAALSNPLMLTMAKTIYIAGPSEDDGDLADPNELSDRRQFPDREAIEQHLLSGFVRAAYRATRVRRTACRWSATEAEGYLKYLALQLDEQHLTEYSWWKLRYSSPYLVPMILALLQGILWATFFWATGLLPTWIAGTIGVVIAIVYFRTIRRSDDRPVSTARWRPGWSTALWFFFAGPSSWIAMSSYFVALLDRVVAASIITVVVVLVLDFSVIAETPLVAKSPQRTLLRDRRVAAYLGTAQCLPCGILVAHAASSLSFPHPHLVGAALSLALYLNFIVEEPVCGFYAITVGWLAMRRKLPIRLMPFLQDAHANHGILRQVGSTFQFRHVELQRTLASR